MRMKAEVVPNVGIGDLHFGMQRDEVIAILGEKQTWEEWMGGNLNDSLFYPGIILSFDKYDAYGPLPGGCLNEIMITSNYSCILFGQEVENITREFICSKVDGYQQSPNRSINAPELGMHISFNLNDTIRRLDLFKSQC